MAAHQHQHDEQQQEGQLHPNNKKQDYYAVLGLDGDRPYGLQPGTGLGGGRREKDGEWKERVRKAYRGALLRAHPDKKASSSLDRDDTKEVPATATATTTTISTTTIDDVKLAFAILSDVRRRKEYDAWLLSDPTTTTAAATAQRGMEMGFVVLGGDGEGLEVLDLADFEVRDGFGEGGGGGYVGLGSDDGEEQEEEKERDGEKKDEKEETEKEEVDERKDETHENGQVDNNNNTEALSESTSEPSLESASRQQTLPFREKSEDEEQAPAPAAAAEPSTTSTTTTTAAPQVPSPSPPPRPPISTTTTWTRACHRCGADPGFSIEEEALEAAEERGEGEVLVGCGGCSLWVRVEFGVVEE